MPRTPRLALPGVPLHIVQRGNNRAACFFSEVDRRFYLKCLAVAAERHGVAVHAYVLMSNHVHMLVSPGEVGSAARMLQDVGRRYVRVINTVHERTGTLWEGRYKSSIVPNEQYILACHRYIELNPVRAGMVDHPALFAWSSYAHYALGRKDRLITEHPVYASLGDSPPERQASFRSLCEQAVAKETLKAIRDALNTGGELGKEIRRRGRPPLPKEAQPPDPDSGNLF